ncbi:MAG: 16S rRNA (uracil(1498)-N(3))-methyltransferase [Phascolarctobacterium sp.]|nr:16S rRNA (uracil(1498)-N(3))-methyltransferase [Phascolarctobacterium sp.]
MANDADGHEVTKLHRFFIPKLYGEKMNITGVDARHINKVLRMQIGDKLQIVSNDGIRAIGEITALKDNNVTVHCLRKLEECHEPSVRIILAQGLAKGEKMDFIVQKAVELGVFSIIPIAMEHSIIKLDDIKAERKVERWQKIAESAAKQSKRDIIPEIYPVKTFEQFLDDHDCDVKFIAYECEDQTSLKKALCKAKPVKELMLIIGPEGGISEQELQQAKDAGAVPVTLGKRILRTETAGLVVMAAVFYEMGDLGD